ncbi:MAG: damage-inducible protein DinB [Methylococcales symbiont of Iophon sp. n. MRB-2018]|nr:MAG: damage-inducible protein DinB [Methylococcales symbiont of Iophon sp. n. MRB-2018]KAF3980555.1 MAG: damage-inducible protein DinB [Methylococcales symbiont of Iophon sp. n. MRB-2018]
MLNELSQLAEYNKLMNHRLYEAASQLSENELKNDRGAFFKSVLGTLNHILVGDIVWLKRFAKHPSSQKSLVYISNLGKPKSLDAILYDDFESLRTEREKIDNIIIQWIDALSTSDIKEYISYKNMAGLGFKKIYVSLINHLFLHQVHHRGQITTLICQSGLDFGNTDLIEIIPEHHT